MQIIYCSPQYLRAMRENNRMKPIRAVVAVLWLGAALGLCAQPRQDPDKLVGRPAELSAWAYAYRADLKVQEKPEAAFILRRLERLDRAYRPVSLLLSQGNAKKGVPWPKQESDWQLLPKKAVWERGELLPAADGVLKSALLWEGRMHLNRVELHWPKGEPAPPLQSVEVRVYPSPYGWFGWQSDQQVTVKPEISEDGSTWIYKGDWDGVDMVAVFVQPAEKPRLVPQIRAYGPETWKRMDVEIEWGFKAGTQQADYDGRVEGFFGLAGDIAPLPGDPGTTMEGRTPGNRTREREADGEFPYPCCISNRRSSSSGTCRSFPTAIRGTRESRSGRNPGASPSW